MNLLLTQFYATHHKKAPLKWAFLSILMLASAFGTSVQAQQGTTLGKSVWLNGTEGDGILAPPHSAYQFSETSDYTVEFWVRGDAYQPGSSNYSSATGNQRVVLLSLHSSEYPFDISLIQSSPSTWYLQWYRYSSSYQIVTSPTTTNLLDGQAHHIALTASASTLTIYVDGTAVTTTANTLTGTTPSTNASMYIGYAATFFSPNYSLFRGALDEIKVYSSTRTQTQINAEKFTALTGNEANLVFYLGMENATGDGSGKTLTNTATASSSASVSTLTPSPLPAYDFTPMFTTMDYPSLPNGSVTVTPSFTSFQVSALALSANTSYDWKVVAAGAGANATAVTTGTAASSASASTQSSYYYDFTATSASTLAQSTNYDVYFKATGGSSWGTAYSFTTLNVCNTAISNLSAANLTATSATVAWGTVPTLTAYEWKVVVAGAGVNAAAVASGTGSATTANATGLTAYTGYDLYVRAAGSCTNATWSAPYSFSTNGTVTPSFTASQNTNDGYIDLNWALPLDPCFMNAGSLYSQGVQLELRDVATNQIVYQKPYTQLGDNIIAPTPTFSQVATNTGSANYEITNTTGNWQSGFTAFTLETWVKAESGTANATIFKCTNSGSNVLDLRVNGTNLILQKGTSNYTLVNNLKYNLWTHIAVTYQNGAATTYINGVQQNVTNGLGLMALNGTYNVMSNFANAQMGELRVWNRVRNATEIAGGLLTNSFSGANQNNLLLHWRWTAANTAPIDLASSYDGLANNGLILNTSTANTVAYTPTLQTLPITGTFRHWVGAAQSKNYTLKLYQIGSGTATTDCSQYTGAGSTLAFQAPTNVAATDNQLHRVTLTWRNKSKLSDNFRIKRSTTVAPITTKVLAVIPGTQLIDSIFTYQDVYAATDTNAITSGVNYSYCVETSNTNFPQTYTQVCDNGKTNLISLVATDNAFPDKVNLSWANLSAYNYTLNLKRDGVVIATVNKTQTAYTDLQPVFGKTHQYALSLTDPTTGDVVIEAFDNGSVAAKGAIAGKVLTSEGFAVKNAKVVLTRNINSQKDSVMTDFQGNFAFNNVYYSTAATFTLTPSYQTHTFSNAPYQVTLNNGTPTVNNIILTDATGFTSGALNASLANFQVTPVSGKDKLSLSWTYTNPVADTIFFNIYRGNVLIKTLNGTGTSVSSFQDSTGIPNASYVYKIVAYKYQSGVVNSATLTHTVSFPAVTVPAAFAAAINTTLGLANLTWTHSSVNYDGFSVFRNGTKIADVAKGTLSYQDKEAAPGASTIYSIKAKRKVENITHESVAATASAVTFPALAPVTLLTATPITTRNSVQLSWTIPASLTAGYNFEGFRIYRNNVYIGEVAKRNITPTYTLPFEDRTGIPNTTYTYVVKTFRRNFDGTLYESAGVSKSGVYPVVSAPTTMVAFNTGQVGQVSFSWNPAAGINNTAAQNIDGQVILRNPSDTVAILPVVVNSHTVFTNSTTAATYSVRTFRIVNGIRYFSTAIQLAAAPAAGSSNPVLPTAFKASNTYPNHVRLSWVYPDYVFSTFKIYRDNVLIATLATDERFYYDYTAVKGANHRYQIEAINGANTAQRVGTLGKLRPLTQLSGVVSSQATKNGIPNVNVTAFVGSNFLARTRTDSAGFYQFVNLPAQTNQLVTVKAEVANHTFVTPSVNIPIGNPIVYNVNFVSTYSPPLIDTVTVTSIAYPTAAADYGKKRMILNWKTTNSNYDGVEIYRTNTLLGTVLTGNTLQWLDSLAQPGVVYTYYLKAYKETNTGRKYGVTKGIASMYPIVEPVKELMLTAKPTLNQVNINWSHGWSNHSYYTIERNGVQIAKVKMDSTLQWNDKTGIPGQTYTYRLRAVQEVNGYAHTSEGVSQTINFPSIAEVLNLAASVPSATMPAIQAPCNTTYTRTRNHVRLTWAYAASTAGLAGYNIYRNGFLIAENVHKDSTAYNDYKGTFGVANQVYKVAVVTKPANTEYVSAGVTVTATFPELSTPYNVAAVDSLSGVKLSWKYDEAVISGFYILRGTNVNMVAYDTVAVDTFKTANYSYLDKNGVPNQTYFYGLKAYSKRDGVELQSQNYTCLASRVYPSPAAPTSLAASDGTYDTYVNVTWNYDITANVQGFEVYRDGLPIAKVEKGQRTYLDYQAGTKGNYTVKAYRFISNQYYYSAASNADDGNPGTSSILIVGQNSNVFERFGGALAANDSLVVVGAPGKGANTMGLVKAFRFNSTTNTWAEGIFWQPGYNGAKTGGSVAINNATQVLIGEPNWSTTGYGYGKSVDATNTLIASFSISGISTSNLGYACAFAGGKQYISSYNNYIKQVYEVNSSTGATTEVTALATSGSALAGDNYSLFSGNKDGNEVKVTAVVSSGTYNGTFFPLALQPSFSGTLSPALTTGSEYGAAIGVSINTGGAADKVFIGAPKQANKGAAYLWTGIPFISTYYYNYFYSPVYFANPNNAANAINDKFGAALDVRGDMAAIGASGFDGGKGAVYLYSIINGVWTNVGKIRYPNSGNDSLGATVKLSKTHLLVGAPNARGGAGIVYQFPLKGLLVDVNATDNQQNATDITWKYWGDKADISGFRIYANGVKIKDMGVNDEVYNYQDGIAGKHYIFEVAAYKSAGNIEYRRYADEGWEKRDGALEGEVQSLPGGAPIADATITATAMIEGNYYQHTATTGTNGKYQIAEVYYGDATATYSLKAVYKDHKFQTNPIEGELSSSAKNKDNLNFFDLSVYTIGGKVTYENTNTGLDSVRVNARYVFSNGQIEGHAGTYTKKDGSYGLTVDPHKLDLSKIEVWVDTTKNETIGSQNYTTHYKYVNRLQEVTNFTNFPQAYSLDFKENTRYNIALNVLTGCETSVTGGLFQIKAKQQNGDYEQVFTTNMNGVVTASLPPFAYEFNVDGVTNGGFENQLVVDYLRYLPQALRLDTMHKTLYGKITQDSIQKRGVRQFLYHRPATITMKGFTYLCDDASKPAKIKQGDYAGIVIKVEETHNNSACTVKGGYLHIVNAAATGKAKDMFLPISSTGETLYQFKGGQPNLVSPYTYFFEVKCITDTVSQALLGSFSQAIVVTGAAQVPGSDIIVDPKGNENAVPIPIFVLRDPPGDGSSATLKKGTTTSRRIMEMNASSGAALVKFELEGMIFKVAGKVESELKLGGGNAYEHEWTLTSTVTEEISTSDSPDYVGEDADIIVGAGLVAAYGITQKLDVNCVNNNTQFVLSNSIGIQPSSLATEWVYTVGHIKKLIEEYKANIEKVEAGTLTVENETKAKTITRFNNYIKNWESVLAFHKKETLPFYSTCAENPLYLITNRTETENGNSNNLQDNQIVIDGKVYVSAPENIARYKELNKWRQGFCALEGIGKYQGNDVTKPFTLDPEFASKWTQDKTTAYNNFKLSVGHLKGDLYLDDEWANQWEFNDTKMWLENAYVDALYTNAHGALAQNHTFSGGTSYTREYESAEAGRYQHTSTFTFDFSASIVFGISSSSEAGLGLSTSVETADFFVGPGIEIGTVNEDVTEVATEKNQSFAYTLTDENEGDQFSTTALQGPSNSFGPYFINLGGRTSCPHEAGTIARDVPILKLYDPATNSTMKYQKKINQKASDPVTFYIQAANNNPFGEERDYVLAQVLSYNKGNATITMFGDAFAEAPLNAIQVGQPVTLELQVTRGPNAYKYDTLMLVLKAPCNSEPADTVILAVEFNSPCSGVTIASPDNNWLIKRRNVSQAGSQEMLPIKITDYDPSEESLMQNVSFEYRRLGVGQAWTAIPSSQVPKATLAANNASNFLPGQMPYYLYSWNITDNFTTYPDGEYEIRAFSQCGLGGQTYSQVMKGRIQRLNGLFGTPEPADQVWTVGDEISVSFNKDIQVTALDTTNFVLINRTKNNTPIRGKISGYNNQLIFTPNVSLKQYDGDSLQMLVTNVLDYAGSKMVSVDWRFMVVGKDLYVSPRDFNAQIYQGDSSSFVVNMINNKMNGSNVKYQFSNLSGFDWLKANYPTGTVVKGFEEPVMLTAKTGTLMPGTYHAYLQVKADNTTTYDSMVHIGITVLPKTPKWVVNPANYEGSMTLISNFNFDNSGVKSTDSTDIISVWIGNQIRGVAKVSKFASNNYAAIMSVYGNASDASKPLVFRVWDASTGTEYDARPDANATIAYVTNSVQGTVANPKLLDVFTASDKVKYIPLVEGWNWMSVNTSKWNDIRNSAMSYLQAPANGDIIKTATKSATYTSGSWVTANGLDSMNVHRGYQLYLSHPDTIRISGSAPSIKPIALQQGWNLIGAPIQTEKTLDSLSYYLVPDSMTMKTVSRNPAHSTNMIATFVNGQWTYANNSNMNKLYPHLAYQLKVNTSGTQLRYPGCNTAAAPVALRLNQNDFDAYDVNAWNVFAPNFAQNMLVTAILDYDSKEILTEGSKVAAFIGEDCRGVGELVYVPELKQYRMAMFVYGEVEGEEISFRVYDAKNDRYFDNYENLTFSTDNMIGTFENPYRFSNLAPDNNFAASVYPNPFTHKFTVNVQADKAQSYTLRLQTLTGQTVYTVELAEERTKLEHIIRTEKLDLTPGIYFLQVIGSLGETQTVKVIYNRD